MTYEEITGQPIAEAEPQAPLTPAQATKRQAKIDKQQAKIKDTQSQAQIKINAAKRQLFSINN